MGAPIHDWPAMLPRINEMRRKGVDRRSMADALGVSVHSLRKGIDALKAAGAPLEPVKKGRAEKYSRSGPILEKLLTLLPRGLSRDEMASEIGVKVGAIYYVMHHRLGADQKKVWAQARGKCKAAAPKSPSSRRRNRSQMIAEVETPDEARRREVFSSTMDRERAARLSHKECKERAQKISDTFQPRRRSMAESHPAMAPGGIAWAAIWNGNPPPYPHDMMGGRFS